MIDKLIELNQKKVSLLIEYREAQKYERCTYHLINCPGRKYYYFLIQISTGKIVREGNIVTINKFIRTRKIKITDIYKTSKL